MEKTTIPLTQLKVNKTAVIKEIDGGCGTAKRLETLGIRPGKTIKKISAHFWKGPITIMMDKTKIAVGYGIARKIIVEI
ncbi:MAG: FeoA family protein [Candidatus Omnitrophota bacterium]